MARVGINISVSDSVFGGPAEVNANSMLIVGGAAAVTGNSAAFSLLTPYLLTSLDSLKSLGITATNNPSIYRQVQGFYSPTTGVNNNGTYLWLVGVDKTATNIQTALSDGVFQSLVRQTVINGFQYRPRQVMIAPLEPTTATPDAIDPTTLQGWIDELYGEGFSLVAVVGSTLPEIATAEYTTLPDLSTKKAGMVGVCVVSDEQGKGACVGRVGGWLSSLSVGTSIGDGSLPAFAETMYLTDYKATAFISTPVNTLAPATLNALGDKQYIFTRARAPKNGLWFNDGATANDATMALSTLEAARTIAAMVDDLRSFFTPYLNTRVPVSSNGDIESTYKSVIVGNATAQVITPYIESGDISDARISLRALNDDMVGTRTWEVTLEILPAPTLRWVDGFVFYVKSL